MFPAADPEFFATPLIAIVDHDPLMRLTMRRLLRTFGYRVATFTSGEDFLFSEHQRMACAVIERDLPGLDGFAVHATLKQRGLGLPVLIVGAEPTADEIARATESGVIEVLRKPVAAEEWLRALEDALRSHPRRPAGGDGTSKQSAPRTP